MIIFPFANYEYFLRTLESPPVAETGSFEFGRFENGELFATVVTPVRAAHCLMVGSIAPPDEQLLSMALLSHTLKKEGANKVTAVLPYLGYSRQDKSKPGKSLATGWLGSILQASGVDEVITVDIHSERSKQLFPIPMTSLFPDQVFAHAIAWRELADATLVAPDNGAIWRCQAVNKAAGRPNDEIAYFEKQRDEKGITHAGPFGKVGPRVLIVDDMIDTGSTLVSACEQLVQSRTREIYIMVTHGLFTGAGWKRLWALGVQRIFCTDTIPARSEIVDEPRITFLSIVPLLSDHLAATSRDAAFKPAIGA
jgi:ribose-phosphate pyrophosphokinase